MIGEHLERRLAGEHRLAAVWQQLREGQVPDREALLEAARFFRRWKERQAECTGDDRGEEARSRHR